MKWKLGVLLCCTAAVGVVGIPCAGEAMAVDCDHVGRQCPQQGCIYLLQDKLVAQTPYPSAVTSTCGKYDVVIADGQCGQQWTWQLLLPDDGCGLYVGPNGPSRSSDNCIPIQ